MQILNLKSGFEPLGEATLHLAKSHIFSGGEIDVCLHETACPLDTEVKIVTRVNNSDDREELLMVTDALRDVGYEKIHVFMPYLPYARQDRVIQKGEAFSLRVFADIINAQGYASVTIFDAHSGVGPALIRRCINVSNHAFVGYVLSGKSGFWLLSPDSGAFSKVKKVADAIHYHDPIALCNKVRVLSGEIEEVTVTISDFGGKDVYIIDDICDGGRTFIALATEIRKRNTGAIYLIVSHGIFSYGEEPLKQGGVDHVFTTDSFKAIKSSYITQVRLCDILTRITKSQTPERKTK